MKKIPFNTIGRMIRAIPYPLVTTRPDSTIRYLSNRGYKRMPAVHFYWGGYAEASLFYFFLPFTSRMITWMW